MSAEIRKARSGELDTIQAIARHTIDTNYRAFLGEEGVDWFIGSGASDEYLRDNLDDCWVLLEQNEIIGFSVCRDAIIDLMMISTEQHRRGFGTTLLGHCERLLFRKEREITLESFEGNEKANGFYRHNGWQQVDRLFDETSGVYKLIFTKRAGGDLVT